MINTRRLDYVRGAAKVQRVLPDQSDGKRSSENRRNVANARP